MPVSETALRIIDDWVDELQNVHWWGPDDPLFPSTEMRVDDSGAFAAAGLERRCWSSTGPIRDVFKRAFKAAGLPYFNPHSFRDMIVRHAMTLDLSPEEMKAWSQNLGHQDVLTTLTSYGAVPSHRQGELIRNLARKSDQRANSRVMADVIEALQKNGIRV